MWYMSIRVILSFIVTIIAILVLRKTQTRKNVIVRVVPIIVAVLSFYMFSLCPVENVFINFDSPEKAFHYLYSGDIQEVANGESSSLIIYTKNGALGQAIIPKNKNGWKLDVFQKNESDISKIVYKHIINVYKARDTDDYYVMVWTPTSDIPDISDSNGSVFMCVKNDNDSHISDGTIFFAYVKTLNENYALNIDGENILIVQ